MYSRLVNCDEYQYPCINWSFFLGNENIHLLTTRAKQELRVDVQKFSGENKYAKYSSFSVASEADKYKLTIGGYSGTAGNRMPLGKDIYFIYIVYSKCDQL